MYLDYGGFMENEPMKQTAFRIEDSLKAAGQRRAKKLGRKFGNYIRFLIAQDTGWDSEGNAPAPRTAAPVRIARTPEPSTDRRQPGKIK